MGQNTSLQIQEFVSASLGKILAEEPATTVITEEIIDITYEQFKTKLGELNTLSRKYLDASGKQLLFAVKKGSDSTVFWKATVQIACVKIDPGTNVLNTYRLFNLKDFLQVFKTLKCQYAAVQDSKNSKLSGSTVFNNLNEMSGEGDSLDSKTLCCICFERDTDVLLPCAHSYCLRCIEEWNEDHNTCPICRESLLSTDDTWVLSEVPRAEEIGEEIRKTLMGLAEDNKPKPCSPS